MSDTKKTLADKVEAISARVIAGQIGRSKPWGGADIMVTDAPPQPRAEPGFYPDPRCVVTPHAKELSWLFETLRDAFSGAVDYQSKYDFYGRLADAADRYTGAGPVESQSAEGLLVAVLDEARTMAREFEPAGGAAQDA